MKTRTLTPASADHKSVKAAEKAILVLSPYQEILYCTKPAVRLIRQYFNITIKNSYWFDCKQPVALNQFICKLVAACKKEKNQFAQRSVPSSTKKMNLEFKAYGFKKTSQYPPLTFIDLYEEDGNDILHSKNVETVISALHLLGDVIWTHDFVKDETWFSGDVNPFTGYKNKDLTAAQRAKVWWIATAKDYKHLLEESDRRYKKGLQKEHTLEYPITDRHGRERWVLDRGMVLKHSIKGVAQLIIGTHTDITNLKKLQAEIEQLRQQKEQDQIETLVTTIETDRKRYIEFLQEDINQFLSAASIKMSSTQTDDLPAEQLITETHSILQQAINEINMVCRMYDPSGLELLSLGEVVADVCNYIGEKFKKPVHLTLTDKSNGAKHYNEELTILRTVQRMMFLFGSSVAAQKALIKITQGTGEIKMTIRFKDPGFIINRFTENNETKMLTRRYQLYGGNLSISKTASNIVILHAWVHTGLQEKRNRKAK